MQNPIRTAIVLCSGHGKRMRPLTMGQHPKQLVPILGKPKLFHTFAVLPDAINKIFIVIGPNGDKIRKACGNEHEERVIEYLEQPECDGTASAVMKATGKINEPFLVLNGDDLFKKEDLTALLKYQWAMLGHRQNEAKRIGELRVDTHMNLQDIRGVADNKESVIVCAGAYVLQPAFFETQMTQLPSGEFGLPQTMLSMVQREEITVKVHMAKFWMPINSPMQLMRAETALKSLL